MPQITAIANIPELLSPAGDWDAMRAAVANGASAVYFGLENFNARHRATNFSAQELPKIMDYLHAHNVKGFLTFNTLIFSDELQAAVDYIHTIAKSGVDAVIVQDLGLARLIQAMAPTLPIHGSTQMTLTEPRGIEFVRQLGVQRVVLARELSIPEIRKIANALDDSAEAQDAPPRPFPELEVFIHGALCVAYSGQCLTSESLGGRSANRGQCAQACRLPYDLIVDGKHKDLGEKAYLLSPQDLAAYDLIEDLAQAGVHCLKIEGRLKSAHYVAATTQTYRAALDALATNTRFHISPSEQADLEQTFSRGFTHGFLSGVNHQQLVSARFPKSRGRRIGTVARTTGASVIVIAERHHLLKPNDGIVFDEGHPEQDEQGGRVQSIRPLRDHSLEITFHAGDVNLRAISPGAIVWKTDDPALRRRLEHSFSRDTVVHRTPLSAEVVARTGAPLTLTFTADDATVTVSSDQLLQAAQKHPATRDLLREQLARLGDTPYDLVRLDAQITGSPMVPKSLLNDLRRQAVQQLLAIRRNRTIHPIDHPAALDTLRRMAASDSLSTSQHDELMLHVLVRTPAQLEAALAERPASIYADYEDPRRYKDAVSQARSAGIPIALATPRIIKPHEEGLLRQILAFAPDAFLVRNLAAVSFFKSEAPQIPQIGDYSLNISNELTAQIFHEAGLARMVPSYDLSWTQLSSMLSRSRPMQFEAVIHQHMPLFHMEHCIFAHTLSEGKDYRDCGRPCDHHQVDLKDRVGHSHPLIPDVGCRNTLFNAQPQSAADYVPRMLKLGLHHFRIELLREKPHEVKSLMQRYADLVRGKSEPRSTLRSLKVLSQLGVTAGTLDRE